MIGYGEWWVGGGDAVGITMRHMFHSPVHADSNAASRRRHLKTIKYYTDYHDVDEDLRAIAIYNEYRTSGTNAGIASRLMTGTVAGTGDNVASKK